MRPDPATRPPDGRRLAPTVSVGVPAAVAFGLLTAVVVARRPWLEQVDRVVVDAVHAQVVIRPWLGRTFEVLGAVTDPTGWRLVMVVVAVMLWRRHRRTAGWLVATAVLGGLLSPLLKDLVARPRPVFDDPVATASGYAYPSGHALGSMVLAGAVVVLCRPAGRRLRRWSTIAAGTFVAVTAVDRVALGVHYPSDVLGGWLAGLVVVCGTTALLLDRPGRSRPSGNPAQLNPTQHEPDREVNRGPAPR